ncbi:hypothetical protein KC332_g9798 [Hortaea werneckii]|nr:hypothetical protein KC358_g9682 [Hortaea werneckii]KAI6824710.1 hypothetical protein KC350_g8949 [Hortaea werneckii]KAI6944569.1 hypothetical protein KC341_g708 [Hortaea werneckii]KAI6950210.1 hypothetical protein KC348_g805 [Hortaea werneckii]KAI6966044.1 hypothetical protein KC321_g9773 [Hortaea werneckii]
MAPAPPAMPSHQTSTAPPAPSAPQGQPGNPPLRLNIRKQQAQALYAKYKAMKAQGVPNTDPQMMHAKSILSRLKRYQEWRRKQHTKAPSEPNASGEPGATLEQTPHIAPQTHEEPAGTGGGGGATSPTAPGTGPTAPHPFLKRHKRRQQPTADSRPTISRTRGNPSFSRTTPRNRKKWRLWLGS